METITYNEDTPSVGVIHEAIRKLTKDERNASVTLGKDEARFLVDAYYQLQDNRIRSDGQVRSMSRDGEPHAVLQWLADMNRTLEESIKSALDNYSTASPVGQWARSQVGIGPVIAAGLLAHLDITKANTAGAFWSYAGMDPRSVWEKGQKRPWNAQLKVLCWKLGESFVKVSGNEKAFYGRIYKERKALETARNEAGEYAAQAAAKLEKFKIGKDTDAYAAYSQGKLPPAHIHARAKRYAVKLFMAHLHEVMYVDHYGTKPPLPYAIAHMDHAHKIEVPRD
jgi:hypothetical protein